MFGRVSRTAIDILGALLVFTAIAVGILGWLLSQGPISLAFLTPLVERAFSRGDDSLIVDVDDTVLAWAGWRRTLDVRVIGVHVIGPGGRLMLEVPEAAVSFSGRALLRGMVAPTAVDVSGFKLRLVRGRDGAIRFGHVQQAGEGQVGAVLVDQLLGPPDPDRSLGYLQRVSITEANVEIVDEASGQVWTARDAEISLLRDAAGLRAEMNATAELGSRPTALTASGIYRGETARFDVSVRLADFDPATLATFDTALEPLRGIHVPLSGKIDMNFDPEFRIASARFDFNGNSGRLSATSFDVPRDIAVRRVVLRGALPDGTSTLAIDEFTVDLNGPTVSLVARLTGLGEQARAEGSATARDVPTDELRNLWPRDLGKNARDWIIANLSGGSMTEAKADFTVVQAGSRWDVQKLGGTLRAANVDVNYLPPMSRVRGVSGSATFDTKRFDIVVRNGVLGSLRATEGKVALYDLDTDIELAAIDVAVTGPVRDALVLIDGPPLGYLKKIDLKPDDFAGDASVNLTLKFPLKKTLKVDELDVLATADVKNFSQRSAALGQDARDGEMKLRVDRAGLDINGRLVLGGASATVEMRRNFADNAPIIARTRARGRLGTAERTAFGFDFVPYLDGPADVSVEYLERRGGRGEVALEANLAASTLALPELEWRKPAGQPASAKGRILIAGSKATAIPEFSLTAGDTASALTTSGNLAFADDGKTISRVDLASLKVGNTDARGSFVRRGRTLALAVSGASFDAGPFQRDKSPPAPDRPPLDLKIDVDRLYFDSDRLLYAVRLEGQRSERWENFDLLARTGPELTMGNHVNLVLKTTGANQTLTGRVENAGAFLRAVDITPNVVGGRMEIKGATDDKRVGRPIATSLHMTEFRLVRAPILARVLSVALLTGILDSLRGEGIGFSSLDAEFLYADPKIEILEAKASGSAIGITARGMLDVDTDQIELDGTIVPANLLNSLPSRIPLIGELLTGGGGGLFAATYRVSGAMGEPRVTVNPLSTLAPGFLRNLFGIFSRPGASPTELDPQAERDQDRGGATLNRP